MDFEIYTCICGNSKWTIHNGFIRCSQCNEKYYGKVYLEGDPYDCGMVQPKEFNKTIRPTKEEK